MAAYPVCGAPSEDHETPLVRTGRRWLAFLQLVAEVACLVTATTACS